MLRRSDVNISIPQFQSQDIVDCGRIEEDFSVSHFEIPNLDTSSLILGLIIFTTSRTWVPYRTKLFIRKARILQFKRGFRSSNFHRPILLPY